MTTKPPDAPERLHVIAAGAGARDERARRVVELIRANGGYRWVGVYDVVNGEVAILAWSGPGEPAVPRFPVTQGLCGAAVRSGESVVVGDVSRDERYLTTFGSTRSEIVVPVKADSGDEVVGVLDVESERPHAFTPADQAWLERCACAVVGLWV